MEYFEIRAFLIFHEYIHKIILFEIFPIKTQNNTENCIKLGTNITNEASKESQPTESFNVFKWEEIQIFGLVQPQTKPEWKILENPKLLH